MGERVFQWIVMAALSLVALAVFALIVHDAGWRKGFEDGHNFKGWVEEQRR